MPVILGGRDENGKTIYFEPDGVSKHYHKGTKIQQPQPQPQQGNLATYDIARDVQELKASVKEIKKVVDAIYFSLKQNQQLANSEAQYDQDREDGSLLGGDVGTR